MNIPKGYRLLEPREIVQSTDWIFYRHELEKDITPEMFEKAKPDSSVGRKVLEYNFKHEENSSIDLFFLRKVTDNQPSTTKANNQI